MGEALPTNTKIGRHQTRSKHEIYLSKSNVESLWNAPYRCRVYIMYSTYHSRRMRIARNKQTLVCCFCSFHLINLVTVNFWEIYGTYRRAHDRLMIIMKWMKWWLILMWWNCSVGRYAHCTDSNKLQYDRYCRRHCHVTLVSLLFFSLFDVLFSFRRPSDMWAVVI